MAGWLRRAGFVQTLLRTKDPHRSPQSQPFHSARGRRSIGDRASSSAVLRLLVAGLSSVLPVGVFVLTGQVVGEVTGPSVIASLLLALVASFLSGLCFAEFETQERSSSGFLYLCCYQTVGELPAFVVGWSAILYGIAAMAAVAKTVSATLNYVSGGKVEGFIEEKFGQASFSSPPLDLVAVGIALVPAVIAALGLRQSLWLMFTSTMVTVVGAIVFIAVGFVYVEYDNWSMRHLLPHEAQQMLTGAAICTSAFVSHLAMGPHGKCVSRPRVVLPVAINAALSIAFITYFGVAIVLILMVHNRNLNTGSSLLQAFEIRDVNWARYMMVAITILCLTFAMLDCFYPLYRTLQKMADDGLLFRCLSIKNNWTSTPLISIISCCLTISVFSMALSLTALIETMASGPLMINLLVSIRVLHHRYQPSGSCHYELMATSSPRNNPRLPSSVKTNKTKPFSQKYSLQNGTCVNGSSEQWTSSQSSPAHSSSTTNLAENVVKSRDTTINNNVYENVELCTTPSSDAESDSESSSDTDIDAIVEEYKEKLRVATLTHIENSDTCPLLQEPTDVTGRRVTLSMTGLIFCLVTISGLIVAVAFHKVNFRHPIFIGSLCLLSIVAFLFLILICRQPQTPSETPGQPARFKTPFLPWTGAISIFFNLCLLLQLLVTVWIPFIIWLLLGLSVYFLYGIRNSTAAMRFRHCISEEQIQLQPLPRHSLISTLIPSHRKKNRDKKPLLREVDTILISR